MAIPAVFSDFFTTRRWARRLLITAVVVLLLEILAWLALPPLIKQQLQQRGSAYLGRTVTVGEVGFHPWSLELTLRDLAVAGADPAQPQLRLQRFYVNLSAASLWRLAPVIDALELDQPELSLRRLADGHYDVDDVLQRLTASSADSKTGPDEALPSFALYNVTLNGGRIELDDQLKQRHHLLEDLTLAVPFLSTLTSQREVQVAPRLAFVLNGSRFDSSAQSLPFSDSRNTSARLGLQQFDLAPYAVYLPEGLPVSLVKGVLDGDLEVNFEQDPQPSVHVRGTLTLHDAELRDGRQQPLLAVRELALQVADAEPLAQRVHLAELRLDAPELTLRRDARGQLEWPQSAASTQAAPTGQADGAGGADAPEAQAAAPAAQTDAPADAQAGWQLRLDKLSLRDGAVDWHDEATRPAANLRVQQLGLEIEGLSWPMTEPVPLHLQAELDGAQLQADGHVSDRQAELALQLQNVELRSAAPYLAQWLVPELEGQASAQATVSWQAEPQQLQVALTRLGLEQVRLQQGKQALSQWQSLVVEGASVDVPARRVSLGTVTLQAPQTSLARDAQGRWMYERWLKPVIAHEAAAPSRSAEGAQAGDWQVDVQRVDIKNGQLDYRDDAAIEPVQLRVRQLDVGLGGFALDRREATPLTLSAALSGLQGPVGRLQLAARLADIKAGVPQDIALTRIVAERLPLQAGMPYVEALKRLQVRRADGSFTGQARYQATVAGPRVQLTGRARVDGVRVDARLPADADAVFRAAWAADDHQLLSWRQLELQRVALELAPGRQTRLDLGDSTLTDLFARLVVTPQGQLNLQGVYGDEDAASDPDASPVGNGQPSVPQPTAAAATAATASSAGNDAAASPLINIGAIRMVNGRIAFSDHFVKPNYSADLSQLTGRLGAFTSQPKDGQVQMAELELQGVAQESAELLITGQVNPLAQPLMLDIRGQVHNLDLPPLSPYSVKYAGYGIERGKLNVDVNYVIQADGQLTASNRIVLNQLAFGDKVDGAGSLPVKLAVALLADRNGVINVSLPVSGSINDPQFSIGGLIWHALGNLLAKAVTAPFALLASAFGGDSTELSTITFADGGKWLDAQARERLDKVAQAMLDRPDLNLTIVGQASLDAERLGFQRRELMQHLVARQRGAQVGASSQTGDASEGSQVGEASSADASRIGVEPLRLSGAAYEAALKAYYGKADLADKPRNFIGLTKSVPDSEMEKLLMAEVPANAAIMQQLAAERAQVVSNYLKARQVPASRLFLGASQNVAGSESDWQPHVELTLGMK